MIFEVIGARSSVFADMPEGMICVGSPAKPVKPRVKSSDRNTWKKIKTAVSGEWVSRGG